MEQGCSIIAEAVPYFRTRALIMRRGIRQARRHTELSVLPASLALLIEKILNLHE